MEQKREPAHTKESHQSAENHEEKREEKSPDEHEKRDEQVRSFFKEEN